MRTKKRIENLENDVVKLNDLFWGMRTELDEMKLKKGKGKK